MALTFAAVLGLHVSMKNEEQSDSIKSWNVKRFKLHPVDRHGDQSVVTEIYNAIDNFMANFSQVCVTGGILKTGPGVPCQCSACFLLCTMEYCEYVPLRSYELVCFVRLCSDC